MFTPFIVCTTGIILKYAMKQKCSYKIYVDEKQVKETKIKY